MFGDPNTMRLPSGAGTKALNSSNLVEKTRELFLMSRAQSGEDSPAVGDFLKEFVQTQMFECFVQYRGGVAGTSQLQNTLGSGSVY